METALEMLCDRTAGNVANKVLVANSSGELKEERRHNVDVVRLPVIKKVGAVAVCPTLPFRLSGETADLIVLHEPNPMALLAYFLARPPAPLIVWFHSEVIRPSWRYRLFYHPFLTFALARARRIVVASPTLAASAVQLAPWRSKCVVIPYGIDHARLRPTDYVMRQADAIRGDHARPIVLFVGRLVRYKGVDVLLDALRGVSADLLLAGDGPERAALQQKAREFGIADRVWFLGDVGSDDLSSLYHACDIVVLPSVTRQEAFGVVQLEAMACGKPVISTDLGTGVGWVNQHRETGLVVSPASAAALTDAIRELLANPALRDAMGAAGIRRTRSVFSIERMIEQTLGLYAEVLGNRVDRKTVA